MNKETINSILTKIIEEYNNKCKINYNDRDGIQTIGADVKPSKKKNHYTDMIESVTKLSDKYGLTIEKLNKSRIILKDTENDTIIDFQKEFVKKKLIDWQNTGKYKYDVEDLFRTYYNLPSNLKNNVKHIVFEKWTGIQAQGYASRVSEEYGDVNTICFPDILFDKKYDRMNSFEFVLAHESVHCLDYNDISNDVRNAIIRYFNHPKQYSKEDYEKDRDIALGTIYGYDAGFQITESVYEDARVKDSNIYWNGDRSKASDYGATLPSEDTAECGAMVTCGYHNPRNKNAFVVLDGKKVQYREWIKNHPYTAQVMIKEIFDEDVSIDTLLAQAK